MRGKTVDELQVGDWAEFSKTLSESDIYLYAGVTGDFNPMHVNQPYAEQTFFKNRIAHGMLVAGFVSTVLANELPGPGTIYVRQEVDFCAPVYIGDTITARAEILEIVTDKNLVKLRTTCANQDEKVVLNGIALVCPPKHRRVSCGEDLFE
jgi:3-hydroxybutyryl-CoA dehydratase